MRHKKYYTLLLLGLSLLLMGCGNSTKMIVDTEINSTQAVTTEGKEDAFNESESDIEESNIDVEESGTDIEESNTDADESEINTEGSRYIALTPDDDGNIVIDKNDINSIASYYNYQSGDTVIQLIGISTESGEKRLAFNTCQSCSPSPQAYYSQQGDMLVCQNCGFEFVPEDVGAIAGGCNPMPIEQLTEESDRFIIPAAYLDSFADVYNNWAGSTS